MNRLVRLTALPRPLLRSFTTSRLVLSTPPRPETPLTHPALLRDPPAEVPQDPWSLTPPAPPPEETGPTLTMAELLASPHPEGRDAEPTETLRKRLVYESRKRGILEMDLILGTFAKTRLADMADHELREYDRVRFLGPSEIGRRGADAGALHTVLDAAGLVDLLLRDRQEQGARAMGVVVGPQGAFEPLEEHGAHRQAHARLGSQSVDAYDTRTENGGVGVRETRRSACRGLRKGTDLGVRLGAVHLSKPGRR